MFDKKSWPMMKHPDLLYMAQKDAQFDVEGRPHHHLFYTTKPNYFEKLNEIGALLREMNDYEDNKLAEGTLDPPDDTAYSLSGRAWLTHDQVKIKFLEDVDEGDYAYLIRCLEHLLKHPYSMKARSIVDDFSVELPGQAMNLSLPEIKRDETNGQIYTEITTRCREHRLQSKIVLNGSGKIDIEGRDILYFEHPYFRRAVLFPMTMAGMQDKIDIFARLEPRQYMSGPSAVASCLREALARSIAAYVDEETRERMRLAGLLTTDVRLKERKKFGQEGARRKYTWKKR